MNSLSVLSVLYGLLKCGHADKPHYTGHCEGVSAMLIRMKQSRNNTSDQRGARLLCHIFHKMLRAMTVSIIRVKTPYRGKH